MLFELPLKVLWIWNCNEAEIALDFYLRDGSDKYQVKGSYLDAFDAKGHLKVCRIDNLDNVNFYPPEQIVYIDSEKKQKKILNYWKNEGGELQYNTLVNNFEKYYGQMNKSMFESTEEQVNKILHANEIEISKKQAADLVFEIEAIVGMLSAVKGEIDPEQVEGLVSQATQGFSEEATALIRTELERRNILHK